MNTTPERTLIDRITHYDAPHFSWDENRLFEGGYYPYIECRPYWGRWDWCPKAKRSVQHFVKRIIRTYYPFKNERAKTDDEFCLHLCLGKQMVMVRKEILDTKKSKFNMNIEYDPRPTHAQRVASWNRNGGSFYGTD